MRETIGRLSFVGGLMLALTFTMSNLSYGFGPFGVSNHRIGINVIVAPEETIAGGLLAFGPNVEIAGDVRGGLKACGPHVVISGDVQGDLDFCGAKVILSGVFHNKVKGMAANLTISGSFEDNIDVTAAKITITPTAIINGDLVYSTGLLERQEGSQIMGRALQRETEQGKDWISKWHQKGKKALLSLRILFWIISIPALIVVGLFINYLFPRQTEAIVSTISVSTWKSLGVGLVFLVVVPVGIVMSFITLVGIPAGIITGLLYGIFIYVSRIYMGVWVGRKLLGYFKESFTTSFFWPLVVGTVIIALLILIPFLGWLMRLFFILIGLGAMWIVIWRSVKPAEKA